MGKILIGFTPHTPCIFSSSSESIDLSDDNNIIFFGFLSVPNLSLAADVEVEIDGTLISASVPSDVYGVM